MSRLLLGGVFMFHCSSRLQQGQRLAVGQGHSMKLLMMNYT
jgi:hypothetical protein